MDSKVIVIITIVIVLVVVLNRIINHQNNTRDISLERVDLNSVSYRTGDVIFFRHDSPLYFYGNNGINTDVHVVKNISKTIAGFSQKYYSHVGIIVVINNIPYVYHLTSQPHSDALSGKSVIGIPVLVELQEIHKYPGMLYIHRYKGPELSFGTNDLKYINSKGIKLCGKFYKVVLTTILGVGSYEDNTMTCADFVNFVMVYLGIRNSSGNPVDLEYIRRFVEEDDKYDRIPVILNTIMSEAVLQ